MLVIRLQLQDLLVERSGLRQESFFVQMIGDADELLDRFVGLAGALVQVAEDVRGIPIARLIFDNAKVFRDGRLHFPLTEQLLSVAQDGSAVDGHLEN